MQRIVTMTILLWSCIALNSQAQSWETAKNKNGIQISTKKVAGQSLKAFKGVITINASTDEIVKVLKDLEAYPSWMPDCNESKLLKKESDNAYYQYVVQDAPWPVSDRDCITYCEVSTKSSGEVLFKIKAVPDFLPKKDGMVRVPKVDSYWKLTPKDGQTVVEYYAQSDPGGSLPDWLVNSAVVDVPFGTLEELRKRVE